MARKTQLIPCRQHEDRILGHCERVDLEAPLHAEEDRQKVRRDRFVTLNMPQCRDCSRYTTKTRCHRCTLEARARKALQYKLQRQREVMAACG